MRKSKKTSKLRVTGLCAGNSPGTGEFPAQMASYAENVSILWRHHEVNQCLVQNMELLGCNCPSMPYDQRQVGYMTATFIAWVRNLPTDRILYYLYMSQYEINCVNKTRVAQLIRKSALFPSIAFFYAKNNSVMRLSFSFDHCWLLQANYRITHQCPSHLFACTAKVRFQLPKK